MGEALRLEGIKVDFAEASEKGTLERPVLDIPAFSLRETRPFWKARPARARRRSSAL